MGKTPVNTGTVPVPNQYIQYRYQFSPYFGTKWVPCSSLEGAHTLIILTTFHIRYSMKLKFLQDYEANGWN
ncbi:hypothetical protein Hanom_Chr07g00627881 [Helianthus anomalus]